jgi:hypothetical protein
MMKHEIVEATTSNGWQIFSQATCSCGWQSTVLPGFNNPSWYDWKREQAEHVKGSSNAADSVGGSNG